MSEGYYDNIEETRALDTNEAVNEHLKGGWKLKKTDALDRVIELEGHRVLQRYWAFLMVLPKGVRPSVPASTVTTREPSKPLAGPRRENLKECKWCGFSIYFEDEKYLDGTKTVAKNPDGSPHRCR